MNTIEQAREVSARLHLGAYIANDRKIDKAFAIIAKAAGNTIDVLIAELADLTNRLHDANQSVGNLEANIATIKAQEPVAWVGGISEGSQLLLDQPARWEAVPLFLAAGAQPYSDSTAELSVGDSSFESWYASYVKEGTKGLKHHCRDAYAAGMGDPLVTYAQTAQKQEFIQPGYQLVPVEPTDKMVQASLHLDLSYMPLQEGYDRAAVYKAMLAAAPVQSTIRDFRTVQDHIKTVDIVGWRWVATCGSGSYQLTDYEPMRGYSYKSPVYEVPPVQAQERKPLFKEFIIRAEKHGYDCANTCNSDTGEWICLNPMTADLWRAWQAAHGIKEQP